MIPRKLQDVWHAATKGDLTRSLASQLAATAVVGILTFALQIAMARVLGPSTFAAYGIALSAAGILVILQDGGFRTIIYREATHATAGMASARQLMAAATGWNLLSSMMIVLIVIASAGLQPAIVAFSLALLVLTNTGRVMAGHVSSLIRAGGNFAVDGRWQVFHRAITVGASLAGLFITGDLLWALACGVLAQVVAFFHAAARRHLERPRLIGGSVIWKTNALFVAADFLTSVYFRSDVLLLGVFGREEAEIGVYSAAMRLVESYVFFVSPIAAIFFRSVRLRSSSNVNLASRVVLLGLPLMLPALLALAVTAIAPDFIMRYAFGERYTPAGAYLIWLMLACVAVPINALLGSAVIARNHETRYLLAVTGAVAVNLALNLLLIPEFGAAAAAATTAATEFSLLLFLGASIFLPGRNRSRPTASGP